MYDKGPIFYKYDPNTNRFINTDGYASTGQSVLGYNMFPYCLNTPVDAVDPNGNFAIPIIGFGFLWLLTMIAAAAGAAVSPAPSFKWPSSSLKPKTNSDS